VRDSFAAYLPGGKHLAGPHQLRLHMIARYLGDRFAHEKDTAGPFWTGRIRGRTQWLL
jgi:hypothetical protein